MIKSILKWIALFLVVVLCILAMIAGYRYYPGDMAAWSLLYNRYVIFEYLDEGRRVEA